MPWETPPGEAFLTAALGGPTFRDDHGLLRIADTHRTAWTVQVVTRVEERDGRLLLSGALSDDVGAGGDAGGAGDLPWSLTLSEDAPGRLDIEVAVASTAGAPTPDRLHLAALLEPDEDAVFVGRQLLGHRPVGRVRVGGTVHRTRRRPGHHVLRGTIVLTYASPFLSPDSGAAVARAGSRDLFAEAEAAGYLVVDTGGRTVLEDQRGFGAALVDLTHHGARDWLADVLVEEVLGVGASGGSWPTSPRAHRPTRSCTRVRV